MLRCAASVFRLDAVRRAVRRQRARCGAGTTFACSSRRRRGLAAERFGLGVSSDDARVLRAVGRRWHLWERRHAELGKCRPCSASECVARHDGSRRVPSRERGSTASRPPPAPAALGGSSHSSRPGIVRVLTVTNHAACPGERRPSAQGPWRPDAAASTHVDPDRRRLIQRPGKAKGWTAFHLPSTPGRGLNHRPPRSPASVVARSSAEAPGSAGCRSACPATGTTRSRTRPAGTACRRVVNDGSPRPLNGAIRPYRPPGVARHRLLRVRGAGRSSPATARELFDEVAGVTVAAVRRHPCASRGTVELPDDAWQRALGRGR